MATYYVPFEDFLPEVRRMIMLELDFDDLKALVHASAVYHQQYLSDRRYLLARCLDKKLGGVAAEVGDVYRSGLRSFAESRTIETVTSFVEGYKTRRNTMSTIARNDFDLDAVMGMSSFYVSVIKPLMKQYACWSLSNLSNEPEATKGLEETPLSRTEESRLIRSLYRLQLCCNLFGKTAHHRLPLRSHPDFSPLQMLQILQSSFDPWELEEIYCVYIFAENKYKSVFEEIRLDVDEKSPKSEGQLPPPQGVFHLDTPGLLEGTISRGLGVLSTVFKSQEHAELVAIMQSNITIHNASVPGHYVFSRMAQRMRRREGPCDSDIKEAQRAPLPFLGDFTDDLEKPHPPLAWTEIWNGTFSNMLGSWIARGIHSWGYIFWDADRLERTDAKKVLSRQLRDTWDEMDPRNCESL